MKLNVLLGSNQVRGIDGAGGLGDVAYALPKALAHRDDVDIRVIMPGFENISRKGLEDRFKKIILPRLTVPIGNKNILVDVCQFHLTNGLPDSPEVICYLLHTPAFDKASDSPEQAILFCRATIEFLRFSQTFRPDVIHCNDWHTGLIPVYLNTIYRSDPFLGRIATLYTTHNSGYGYQGAFPNQDIPTPTQKELVQLAGLTEADFQSNETHSVEHLTLFNFAKGGFGYADLINTVSLNYAHEIQTPAFGGGFDGLLVERSHDLCGIVDGIDTHEWDPCHDPYIAPNNYSNAQSAAEIHKVKQNIRSSLKQWEDMNSDLPFTRLRSDSILISVVGRIADQKFPILLPVLEEICSIPKVQCLILGSAHPMDHQGQDYTKNTATLAAKLKNNLFFFDGFDVPLSHMVYAASDIILMPSMYEPCGLTQLIAMRYGTVPVVRAVGGLEDTIIDEAAGIQANGFKFKEPVEDKTEMADISTATTLLLRSVIRAVRTLIERPDRWTELILNGMSRDSSWSVPAPQYMKLYNEAVNRRIKSQFLL